CGNSPAPLRSGANPPSPRSSTPAAAASSAGDRTRTWPARKRSERLTANRRHCCASAGTASRSTSRQVGSEECATETGTTGAAGPTSSSFVRRTTRWLFGLPASVDCRAGAKLLRKVYQRLQSLDSFAPVESVSGVELSSKSLLGER